MKHARCIFAEAANRKYLMETAGRFQTEKKLRPVMLMNGEKEYRSKSYPFLADGVFFTVQRCSFMIAYMYI